ncbi:hypothetical protein JG687_00003511 [Phytophthora cactorum]|uniref:Uncharacterized protein n=1 Tax=Phytophthora cactorum TaxID=29920 RepID=A0A329S455_9STRA|nr:hypothetical protein GQ600_14142 [Phytophthora cactorum]KAG3109390.1 hypothetical protein PI125_g10974 [Phytophthora idaei]KAG2826129.1 hypothetical protein PC112_g9416 [Phytophthora cactorum]KAG2846819.1 hypothetical protein PC111_g1029 [Phytophthora cactorum]KAG2858469.1 hypothetical protein PC113_g9789 [Phytophthora cactorum]
MNPESDECGVASGTKDSRRKKVFQRRLLDQLSESRMLEVLDRKLQRAGHSTGLGNQEQEEEDRNDQGEEELVCVSKMVKVADAEPALSKSSEFQAGGVLKTVRYIHRQRAKPVAQGNQAEH